MTKGFYLKHIPPRTDEFDHIEIVPAHRIEVPLGNGLAKVTTVKGAVFETHRSNVYASEEEAKRVRHSRYVEAATRAARESSRLRARYEKLMQLAKG